MRARGGQLSTYRTRPSSFYRKRGLERAVRYSVYVVISYRLRVVTELTSSCSTASPMALRSM